MSALILITLLKRLALKINFVSPDGVTCLGGLGMWLAFSIICVLTTSICGQPDKTVWGIVLGSGLLVAFGMIDDSKKELSVPIKFLVQIAAAILLILCGIKTQIVYIGSYPNLLITFLWVLGITNAFNHLDIMDGLAGGIAAISSAAFFLIALLTGNPAVAVFSLALTAVTLSFLRYNLTSTRVYMGNSGSHFLGFALSAIAITISYAPLERRIALLSPILILGLAIFDTTFVMFMRMKKGRSVFKKSDDHFALKLLAAGYSKRKVIIFMYLLGLFFALSGLIVSRVPNQIGLIVLIVVVFICLVLGRKISREPVNG